ncbi:hypothetical protein ES708_33537 [subsurface metagenome]
MGSGTEGLPHGKENHCNCVQGVAGKKIEDEKGENIGAEGEDHGPAPAVGIGYNTRRYLEQVCGDLTNREQRPDLEKGKTHLPKE